MTVIAELLARLGVDQRDFEKKMKRSEKLFDKTAKRLLRIGRDLSIGLTAPLTAIGAIAIRAFADFDQALTQSAAIMSDTEGRMGELEDAARDVGRSTTFSATNAAEAFFFLASAGLDVSESIAALPQVTRFAQAGMFDLSTATDLATDAMSALGLEVDSLTRVTDVLVKANTIANASTQQFSEALTAGAGVAAKAAGIELEEVVAVLAAFADQGIKSSEAGSKFNIVVRDLTTKALRNADAFRRFNIEVFDTFGNLNPLSRVIGDVEDALDGMSTAAAKATLLTLGFTDKSVLAFQALLGLSDQIAEYESVLQRAGGTTQEISDRQLTSFANQWKLITSQIDDLLISLGNALVPLIQDIVVPVIKMVTELVTGWIDTFLELDRSTQVIIAGAVALAAAIGPLSIAIGGLFSIASALAGLLATGFAPILVGGALIAGVAALSLAFSGGSKSLEAFRRSLDLVIGDDPAKEIEKMEKAVVDVTKTYKDLSAELKELIAIQTNLWDPAIFSAKTFAEILANDVALELAVTKARIVEVTAELDKLDELRRVGTAMGLIPVPFEGGDESGGVIARLSTAFDDLGFKMQRAFMSGADSAQSALESMGRTAMDFLDTTDERFAQFSESAKAVWDNFIIQGLSAFEQLKIGTIDFFNAFASGLGNSLAQIIVFGEDAGEVFERFFKNLLAQTISTLVTIGAQWLLATIFQSTLGVALHTQRVAQAAQLIFLNTAAGLAFLNPFGAGLVAAGITAATVTASTGIAAAAGAVGGATSPLGLDTGGLITRDGAAFLHAGEVVATPEEVQSALTGEGNASRPIDLQVMLDGRMIMRQLIRHFGSEIRIRGA